MRNIYDYLSLVSDALRGVVGVGFYDTSCPVLRIRRTAFCYHDYQLAFPSSHEYSVTIGSRLALA